MFDAGEQCLEPHSLTTVFLRRSMSLNLLETDLIKLISLEVKGGFICVNLLIPLGVGSVNGVKVFVPLD